PTFAPTTVTPARVEDKESVPTNYEENWLQSTPFQAYHEARQVSDDDVLATVQTLHRAGAKRKRILQYVMENMTVVPQMKDVHNLVARLQSESYVYPEIEKRFCIVFWRTSHHGMVS
ncbi:hypothetical protein GN958_ATG08731, partial [Phytophthora infestans]